MVIRRHCGGSERKLQSPHTLAAFKRQQESVRVFAPDTRSENGIFRSFTLGECRCVRSKAPKPHSNSKLPRIILRSSANSLNDELSNGCLEVSGWNGIRFPIPSSSGHRREMVREEAFIILQFTIRPIDHRMCQRVNHGASYEFGL